MENQEILDEYSVIPYEYGHHEEAYFKQECEGPYGNENFFSSSREEEHPSHGTGFNFHIGNDEMITLGPRSLRHSEEETFLGRRPLPFEERSLAFFQTAEKAHKDHDEVESRKRLLELVSGLLEENVSQKNQFRGKFIKFLDLI